MDDVKEEEELVAKALAGELKVGNNSNDIMCDMEVLVDGESFTVSIPKIKIYYQICMEKERGQRSDWIEGAIHDFNPRYDCRI